MAGYLRGISLPPPESWAGYVYYCLLWMLYFDSLVARLSICRALCDLIFRIKYIIHARIRGPFIALSYIFILSLKRVDYIFSGKILSYNEVPCMAVIFLKIFSFAVNINAVVCENPSGQFSP